MIINQIREYHSTFTESELFVNGDQERFCYVLEDIGRPLGVKRGGYTCIPEGVYQVTVTHSARWNKKMLLLYNTKDLAVERYGVRFTGVRPHGGNDITDTHGCPLLAYNSDHKGKVWARASDDLFDIVKKELDQNNPVKWVICSI